MKMFYLFFILFILISCETNYYKYNEQFNKDIYIDPSSDKIIYIENDAGDISIKENDISYVQINAEKYAKKFSDDLNKIKISIKEEGRTIYIKTEYFNSVDCSDTKIDYNIKIPKNVKISKAQTSNGNIFINNLKNIEIDDLLVSTGDIKIENSYKIKKVINKNGEININNVEQIDVIENNTGNINIKKINNFNNVKNDSGNIDIDILNDKNNMEIENKTGKVTAYIYEKLNLKLNLNIKIGKIDNEFSGTTIGTGGKELKIYVFSGYIKINKKSN